MFNLQHYLILVVDKVKKLISYMYDLCKDKSAVESRNKKPSTRSKIMKFYLNDPMYPDLIGTAVNPRPNGLLLSNNCTCTNCDYTFESPEGLACNSYAILCEGINIFNKYFNLKKWAAVNMIHVYPAAGEQANAFYDRRNFKFFYFTKNNKKVYTSLSADIVLHELGHGLLDAIRPDLFSAASIEVWSFHEAFGDINSIICTLHFDKIIDKVLSETNYNLKQSNIVTKVAEEFGLSLGSVCGLREAYNDYKYVKPETLPERSKDPNALVREPHSFSKVMTGIFYEILSDVYEKLGKNKEALINARDYMKETFYKACIHVPSCPNFYEAFCESWIVEDSKMPVSHKDVLVKVFQKRNIFKMTKMNTESQQVDKEKLFTVADSKIKLEKYKYEMKVKDLIPDSAIAMSDNEFINMKVQLAVDEMYIKSDFMSWQNISNPIEDAKEAAKSLLNYIIDNKLFGSDDSAIWYKDENNTLARRMFQCDCYINNCKVEGSPEYGKCWKPENNSGCCTYGSCSKFKKEPIKKIEKNCNLRYSSTCGQISYNSKCN